MPPCRAPDATDATDALRPHTPRGTAQPLPWSEALARATILRVVRDTEDRFSADRYCRRHRRARSRWHRPTCATWSACRRAPRCRKSWDHRAAQRGRQLNYRIRVGSFDEQCRLVARGAGIVLMPQSTAERHARALDAGHPHRAAGQELCRLRAAPVRAPPGRAAGGDAAAGGLPVGQRGAVGLEMARVGSARGAMTNAPPDPILFV